MDEFELRRTQLIITDEKLGAGAFGAVYKGQVVGQLRTHRHFGSMFATAAAASESPTVAVKMLPRCAGDISKAEFIKEINLMKELGYHDCLVNVLGCVTVNEPYLLVVEYCSDGDLLNFLRNRCKYMMQMDKLGKSELDESRMLSLKDLYSYAQQISHGLEYLSQAGFIHRDVAARNVLIHARDQAKIGDFGLCRYVLGDDPAYWGRGGRLPARWMAPEALLHYKFSTHSDIWSLGVLLFELITLGGTPYPNMDPADLAAFLVAGGRLERPHNCPEPFYEVMLECWALEPEERISARDAKRKLYHMLEQVADGVYLRLDEGQEYYKLSDFETPEPDQTKVQLALVRGAVADVGRSRTESLDSGTDVTTPTTTLTRPPFPTYKHAIVVNPLPDPSTA